MRPFFVSRLLKKVERGILNLFTNTVRCLHMRSKLYEKIFGSGAALDKG